MSCKAFWHGYLAFFVSFMCNSLVCAMRVDVMYSFFLLAYVELLAPFMHKSEIVLCAVLELGFAAIS